METIFATQTYEDAALFVLYDFIVITVGIWTEIPVATTLWTDL